jgi:hypothetical protein
VSVLDVLADRVLAADRIIRPPVILREENPRARCVETPIEHRGPHFAVLLKADDHSRALRGSRDAQDGYRNLPDYVVFSEAQAKGKAPVLRALLVELKSSEAGKERAMRQIQLGAPLAHYLLSLARVDHDAFKSTELHQAGLILCPDLPTARPRTRRGASGYEPGSDAKTKIYVYDAPCGDDVYLDGLFYCPASV